MFILHGWTHTPGDTWKALLSILQERGVDAEFLSIPGLSDGTDPVWTLEDYVEWLRKKTSPYGKVILCGHSNGARISMAFAATYPEKITKLIIEDASGVPPSGLRKLKRNVFRAVAKLGGSISRSENMRKFLYKVIRENDYHRASANMKKTMANLMAVDIRTRLSKITAPTLVLWGAGDKTTPLAAGRAIHAGIRGSTMLLISGARHSPHITHPQEVADAIVRFISA